MHARDWTLLVIAAGRRPLSPVQLQKSLFLISAELSARQRRCESFYKFRPYDYGPFSSEIYRDAELLQTAGLITIEVEPGRRIRSYQASEAGFKRSRSLLSTLDVIARDYLQQVVNWVQSQPFESLVRAIYKAYPKMAANSIFRS
jgi:uncharacterized protein YwgA